MKEHQSLIRAFAQVVEQCPAAHLEIIGRGPERGGIKKLAKSLGIRENVTLRGEIPNARTALEQWDIYAQSSVSEGMPRAVLEAMAAGLPVVATDVGGVREVLDSTGMLVPAEDPAAMAQAVLELLNDHERSKAIGAAARQRVATKFSHEAFAMKHFQLYREISSRR